jgi:hypothetical protein
LRLRPRIKGPSAMEGTGAESGITNGLCNGWGSDQTAQPVRAIL